MQTVLIVIHVLVSIALISLVLVQRGKGADMGVAFGSGASQTVFGSQGSASFLTRTTAILATVFFITSLSLAYFTTKSAQPSSVTEIQVPAKTATTDQMPSKVVPKDTPEDVPAVPVPETQTEQSSGTTQDRKDNNK